MKATHPVSRGGEKAMLKKNRRSGTLIIDLSKFTARNPVHSQQVAVVGGDHVRLHGIAGLGNHLVRGLGI